MNIDLDKLFGVVPVLYILFTMDSILLISISSCASIILTETMSGPVAFSYFMLFKACSVSSFKLGGPSFSLLTSHNHGLCKCVSSIVNRREFDLLLALLES